MAYIWRKLITMSARKTIIALALDKGVDLHKLAKDAGYTYLHHFQRALDNGGGISAKRVIRIAKSLRESPEYILSILTDGRR